MRLAFWIPKATNTHSDVQYSLFFHYNNGCTDAPQCFGLIMANVRYIALYDYWPVEELAELAYGPTGCGEVARGGC